MANDPAPDHGRQGAILAWQWLDGAASGLPLVGTLRGVRDFAGTANTRNGEAVTAAAAAWL
jgi:hypothetical protein